LHRRKIALGVEGRADHVTGIEELSLVLVEALDLHVEQESGMM